MKLSILIPHLYSRGELLNSLLNDLDAQIKGSGRKKVSVNRGSVCRTYLYGDIEVIINADNGEKTVGEKRNELMNEAKGEYTCFHDDDDKPGPNYIKHLLDGISKGVDCCSLTGELTVNGKQDRPFYHNLSHTKYWDDDKGYYRFPNHLNCVKRELVKNFTFPEKNFSEDTEWAYKVHEAGVLKTEHTIPETIYYYNYTSKK